jgi:hypothetical protein
MANKMRAKELLSIPFYHPVLEEALRTALGKIARQSQAPGPEFEFSRCGIPLSAEDLSVALSEGNGPVIFPGNGVRFNYD